MNMFFKLVQFFRENTWRSLPRFSMDHFVRQASQRSMRADNKTKQSNDDCSTHRGLFDYDIMTLRLCNSTAFSAPIYYRTMTQNYSTRQTNRNPLSTCINVGAWRTSKAPNAHTWLSTLKNDQRAWFGSAEILYWTHRESYPFHIYILLTPEPYPIGQIYQDGYSSKDILWNRLSMKV